MAFESQDVVRVSARMTKGGGQDMVGVWHFALQDVGAATQAQILEDIVERMEYVYDQINHLMSDEVTFEDITVYIEGKDDSYPPQAFPTLTVGSLTDTSLPAATCVLGLMSTGVKRIVGRKYLGGFTEAHWSDTGWTSTLTTQAATMLGVFASLATMTNGVDIIGGVWSPTQQSFNTITGVRIQGDARYQRRRRLGAGS